MKRVRTALLVTVIAAVAVAGLVVLALRHLEWVVADAAVYEAACRQVLANTTAGRQALVSSVWWPPLHVLLRLGPAALWPSEAVPLASLVVSAACGVGALLLAHGILRAWNLGPAAWLATAAMAAHPAFVRLCLDGSAGSTLLLLVLMTAFGSALWVSRRQVRFLVYYATGAALLVLADLYLGLWAVAVFLLLAMDQLFWRAERSRKESVLILAALPALYAAGLWCLLSWLIMGDGLFFVRSLSPGWRVLAAVPVDWAPATIAGAVLGGGVVLAVVRARARWLAVMLALAALGYSVAAPRGDLNGRPCYADVLRERVRRTVRIARHVRGLKPYPRVFVCGYDAFRLLGGNPGEGFEYGLDFHFEQARRDYYGQDLYVLVHAPHDRSAMDSVHLRFPRIYALGHRATLYEGEYGPWRLYEIVQAPQRGGWSQ